MADRILIQGLRVFGHHGVLESEIRDGQFFLVDLECELDLAFAGRSDDLNDTVDYEALTEQVRSVIAEGESCRLLEALAQRIADAALQRPQIASAKVKIVKPAPPVQAEVAGLGVEIFRSR